MAANEHNLIVRAETATPAPELTHRHSFISGERAGMGYLQPDGSLTNHVEGGVVVVRDSSGLHLHHVALNCRSCGTA